MSSRRILLAMSIGATAATALFVLALTTPTMIVIPASLVIGFAIARLERRFLP